MPRCSVAPRSADVPPSRQETCRPWLRSSGAVGTTTRSKFNRILARCPNPPRRCSWPPLAPSCCLTHGGAACARRNGSVPVIGFLGRTSPTRMQRMWLAGFRQQSGGSRNVNYPIWPDLRCAPETSAAMRQHLQVQYDTHGLGRVPEPAGGVGDVGAEHVTVLLESSPSPVSCPAQRHLPSSR
jgi:hypothetical protein